MKLVLDCTILGLLLMSLVLMSNAQRHVTKRSKGKPLRWYVTSLRDRYDNAGYTAAKLSIIFLALAAVLGIIAVLA